jgi:hypothetical protein
MRWSLFLRICLLLLLCACFLLPEADARRNNRRHRGGRHRGHRRHRHRRHRQQDNDVGVDEPPFHNGIWGQFGAWNVDEVAEQQHQSERIPVDKSKAAHMMLVLQWPESLCASEKRGCKGEVFPYWTLHGLWPTSRRLVHCRSDFDEKRLYAIHSNLTQQWPSYFRRTGFGFWKHEYDKHGSCLYGTIEEYFDSALKLQHQYHLLQILHPKNEAYPLDYFISAVKSALGVEPNVMCRTNWLERRVPLEPKQKVIAEESGYEADDEREGGGPPARREQLLVEIGLCFNTKAELVDCPVKGRIRRCTRNQPLTMPPLYTFTERP